MKKHWSLFWLFRRLSLMKLVEYRSDFYFWMVVSIMWTIFNFFFFTLLLNLQGTIGGWTHWEMYTLLGVFTMIDAFTWSFMAQNMWHYTRLIFNGGLSSTLIKPIDPQFAVMTSETSYNNVPRFLIGLSALIWAVFHQGIQPNLLAIIGFIIVFSASIIFVYSLWFLVATLAFWVEKLDNINEIVPAFRRMWQVPRSVYSGLSSTLFTVVLPVGLVTSLPTEIILNRPPGVLIGYFLLITGVTFVASRYFFLYSIRKYTSIGG